jgi:hypothetical protein
MAEKPTFEEMERRVRNLTKLNLSVKGEEDALVGYFKIRASKPPKVYITMTAPGTASAARRAS